MVNSHRIIRNLAFSFLFIAFFLFAVFASGCASVNPEPFKKYKISLREAQTGSDAAMSVNYGWSRSGFVEGFSNRPGAEFSKLLIQPGKEYLWTWPEAPIYLQIKQARAALFQLNDAFCNYAGLLAKLAGDELISKEDFESMAKDLNANAISALKSLQLSAPIALFSIAATEAARLYIENKRQSYLQNAIHENQANIQDYADKCVSIVHTIRGNIKSYYVDRSTPYRSAWAPANPSERQKLTESMLALNEQFIDSLRVLQELEKTYSELPGAHADLAKSIDSEKFDLHGIQSLYSSAQRLQRLYKELVANNAK